MTDWATEALPVLQAIYEVCRENFMMTAETNRVRERLGYDAEDLRVPRALIDLAKADYVKVEMETDAALGPYAVTMTEKGLQVVAGWPAPGGESFFPRLLAELDERIAAASTDEERTKFERFRAAIVGMGREVVTNVVSAAAEGAVRGIHV